MDFSLEDLLKSVKEWGPAARRNEAKRPRVTRAASNNYLDRNQSKASRKHRCCVGFQLFILYLLYSGSMFVFSLFIISCMFILRTLQRWKNKIEGDINSISSN